MSEAPRERFDADYFHSVYANTGCRPLDQHWWSVRLYAGVADRLLSRHGGRRMLEVGCGLGYILAVLERKYETFGVDVSAYAIDECRRVAPRSQCSVADIERGLPAHLERGTFDLVLARYVFEHLRDPRGVLRKLAALLRPGGFLFFSVPNTESLGARWKGSEWYARKDPTHCSVLPPETWLEYTRLAGLRLEREFSDGYWDVPYVRWLPRWAQWPLFLMPSALACLLARPVLPARFGENVMVIAQKAPETMPHEST